MKRATVFLSGAIFALTFFYNTAMAAEKFGYVSIDKVGDSYLKAKQYMKALEDKGTAFSAEIEKKKNEVKAFQDKVNLLSEKERDAKTAELETKIKSLQDFVRQKQADLRKEEFDKTMELSNDIRMAIDKHSAKEGYTLVFDAAALAYKPKEMDITDKVVDILNKGYKK